MSRPVLVLAKFHVVENGVIVVAAGTEGVVISAEEPPTLQRYEVEFTIEGTTIRKWLLNDQLVWRDGILGPVRAILNTRSAVIVDADYNMLMSTDDLIINQSLTFNGGFIDLKTDDGYAIRIHSDQNNDLVVTYVQLP